MKLVVGLGNIGKEYDNTRHNIGFEFIDFLANKLNLTFNKEKKLKAEVAKANNIIFAKPTTYMNLSGDAINKIACFYKIKREDILVIQDEISLNYEIVKFSFNRGAGGQHGIEDIIRKIGGKNFSRIRIGVGPDPGGDKRSKFVLSKFTREEQEKRNKIFEDSLFIYDQWLNKPIEKIQNPNDKAHNAKLKNKKMKYKLKKGLTLWLTGLSGAGKSTISEALIGKLTKNNKEFPLELLDGDEIRDNLNQGLSFSKEDRFTNIKRIAFLAGKLSKHGVLVLVPVIAPYEEARQMARSYSKNFIEIFVNASLEKVEERDVKGLYAKARSGEIENFTGISDPYEAPLNPDIELNTDKESISESVEKILNKLIEKGYVENF